MHDLASHSTAKRMDSASRCRSRLRSLLTSRVRHRCPGVPHEAATEVACWASGVDLRSRGRSSGRRRRPSRGVHVVLSAQVIATPLISRKTAVLNHPFGTRPVRSLAELTEASRCVHHQASRSFHAVSVIGARHEIRARRRGPKRLRSTMEPGHALCPIQYPRRGYR